MKRYSRKQIWKYLDRENGKDDRNAIKNRNDDSISFENRPEEPESQELETEDNTPSCFRPTIIANLTILFFWNKITVSELVHEGRMVERISY